MSEWLTLDDARARLGLHPDTLRRQVRRGQREGRKDNLGRWLVRVDPGESGRIDPGARVDNPGISALVDPDTSGQLREQVARLEERLAAAEQVKTELRERDAELRADLERERLWAEAAEARQAEQDRRLDEVLRQFGELRAQPLRRPWPGLKSWWQRVWEGKTES